jgi:hypothetical protein
MTGRRHLEHIGVSSSTTLLIIYDDSFFFTSLPFSPHDGLKN